MATEQPLPSRPDRWELSGQRGPQHRPRRKPDATIVHLVEHLLDEQPRLDRLLGGLQRLVPGHRPLVLATHPRDAAPQIPAQVEHPHRLLHQRSPDVVGEASPSTHPTLSGRLVGQDPQHRRRMTRGIGLQRLRLLTHLRCLLPQPLSISGQRHVGQPDAQHQQRTQRLLIGGTRQRVSLTSQLLRLRQHPAIADQRTTRLIQRRTRPVEPPDQRAEPLLIRPTSRPLPPHQGRPARQPNSLPDALRQLPQHHAASQQILGPSRHQRICPHPPLNPRPARGPTDRPPPTRDRRTNHPPGSPAPRAFRPRRQGSRSSAPTAQRTLRAPGGAPGSDSHRPAARPGDDCRRGRRVHDRPARGAARGLELNRHGMEVGHGPTVGASDDPPRQLSTGSCDPYRLQS